MSSSKKILIAVAIIYVSIPTVVNGMAVICPGPFSDTLDLSFRGLTADDIRNLLDCNFLSFVRTLNLSGNLLTSLSLDVFKKDGLSFYNLQHLDVSNNQIKWINSNTFSPFRLLKTLNISKNCLTSLEDGLLENLNDIEEFIASFNNISKIGNNVFPKNRLRHLKYVGMRNNSLTSFEPWPYVIVNNRYRSLTFDVSYNLIENFTNNMNWKYDLIEPYDRIRVNLTYNRLSKYRDAYLQQYNPTGDVALDIATYMLDIRHNPWFCDCYLHYVVSEFQNSFYRFADSEFNVNCAGPWQLRGKDIFHEVDSSLLVCNLTDNCPTGCLCQRRPHEHLLYIDCSNGKLTELPKSLPNLESDDGESYELHFENNSISEFKSRYYNANVSKIYLSGNGMKSVDASAIIQMDQVQYLDVSRNQLKYVPKQIQKLTYDKVYIINNPFVCDCDMTWMSGWIALSRFDTLGRNIECTNEDDENMKILQASDNLDCDYKVEIGLAVSFGLLFVVVVIVIVWAKRCPYETKVLLFKFFRFHPADRYLVDEAASTDYDLYVSFDDENIHIRQWVLKKMIRRLEQEKPLYRLFIPCRDLMTGGEKGPDIITAMQNSSRVLIILSNDYDKNEWCLFETQQAELLDYNEGRVMFMKYHAEVDKMIEEEPLKSRVKGRAILTTGEKGSEKWWFWSKLRYELSVKRKQVLDRTNYVV